MTLRQKVKRKTFRLLSVRLNVVIPNKHECWRLRIPLIRQYFRQFPEEFGFTVKPAVKRRHIPSMPSATPSNTAVAPPSGTPAPAGPKSVHLVRPHKLKIEGIVITPCKSPMYQTSAPRPL